ncbi:MAG: DUF1043 family protein [Acidiferrobacterales bacterium]|nr:DUF1043 family protein [Acidiferrobacterales bacterium]
MEFTPNIILALVIGVFGGGIVGYMIARTQSKNNGAKQQLEKLQTEMNEYRSNVRSHFIDTVSLLSQIDQRQKQLHQAVAEGVVELCASDDSDGDYLLEQSVHSLRQLDQDPSDDEKHSD